MIKYTENESEIIELWMDSFGDSLEDVKFFIDNSENVKCLAYYVEGNLASMLFLVDCFYNGLQGSYIYAACTHIKYRKMGLMTKLLNYAKEHANNFVCLIPADKALVKYYYDREFINKINIANISFKQKPEITEYLFEGCQLEEPFALMYKGE